MQSVGDLGARSGGLVKDPGQSGWLMNLSPISRGGCRNTILRPSKKGEPAGERAPWERGGVPDSGETLPPGAKSRGSELPWFAQEAKATRGPASESQRGQARSRHRQENPAGIPDVARIGDASSRFYLRCSRFPLSGLRLRDPAPGSVSGEEASSCAATRHRRARR